MLWGLKQAAKMFGSCRRLTCTDSLCSTRVHSFFRADQLNIVSAKCVKQSLKNVCKIRRHAHGLMAAEKLLSRLARHYIFWPFIMRNFEIVIHAINIENIYVSSFCLANNLQVFVANLWITSLCYKFCWSVTYLILAFIHFSPSVIIQCDARGVEGKRWLSLTVQ